MKKRHALSSSKTWWPVHTFNPSRNGKYVSCANPRRRRDSRILLYYISLRVCLGSTTTTRRTNAPYDQSSTSARPLRGPKAIKIMTPYVQSGHCSMARRRATNPACTLLPSACSPHTAHVAHVIQLARFQLPHVRVVVVDGVGRERHGVRAPHFVPSTNGRASGIVTSSVALPPAFWADACLSTLSCKTKLRSDGRPARPACPHRTGLCLRAPRAGNVRSSARSTPERPRAARARGASKITLPTPSHDGRRWRSGAPQSASAQDGGAKAARRTGRVRRRPRAG
jgi:hypothetical protein